MRRSVPKVRGCSPFAESVEGSACALFAPKPARLETTANDKYIHTGERKAKLSFLNPYLGIPQSNSPRVRNSCSRRQQVMSHTQKVNSTKEHYLSLSLSGSMNLSTHPSWSFCLPTLHTCACIVSRLHPHPTCSAPNPVKRHCANQPSSITQTGSSFALTCSSLCLVCWCCRDSE